MLRIIQNQAAESAKSYYSQADYLSEGQEQVGTWGGKTAEMLGLAGQVSKRAFDRLCDNLYPLTGQQLTPRTRHDRTVGYDINFHCPKGVSTAYSLLEDDRILEAFEASVAETMEELEQDARTRVRKNGVYADKVTGNLVWAGFTHLTARPVDGVPDGHLHKHCFTFNVTWDDMEQTYKACQFREIKRDAPYYEAAFHARMAKRLADLGYTIERKGRSWDIADVPQSVRDKFSRRSGQIEALAEEEGIIDAREKDKLAAKSREQKRGDLSMDQLRELWWSRLDDDEKSGLQAVPLPKNLEGESPDIADASQDAMGQAALHCFERRSVVPERQLLAEGLRRGLGQVTVDSVLDSHRDSEVIVREFRGRKLATLPEVWREEQALFDYARDHKGLCEALNDQWVIRRDWLNGEQREALNHLITSRDGVVVLRGGAGTGKTSLMQEAAEAIEAGGHAVLAFAPSAEASRGVLQSEGFAGATTVAELLVNDKLQAAAKGNVIWIDEAGLVGTKTLRRVFDLADHLGARLVLSGDWKQHGSVERGSALRLLEQYAGLKPAGVKEIQRQKGRYRDAVAAIASGDLEQGFAILDELGWIKEVGDETRNQQIAIEYADSLKDGKSCLVVSPTRAESDVITRAIRSELRSRNKIGDEEFHLLQLKPLHLTEAEKQDAAFFQPGDVLVFQQNAGGHQKGERIVARETVDESIRALAPAFAVYRRGTLELARGDLVKITANGKTMDGQHRLNNGAVYRVKGLDDRGNLQVANGWTIAANYGFLSHGYVSTSFSAQGKTVDHVILAESGMSFPAGSQEQAYVSVSRGRQKCTVYTDDAEQLREAVAASSIKLSATELLGERRRRQMQRQAIAPADSEATAKAAEGWHVR